MWYEPQISASPDFTESRLSPPKMNWTPTAEAFLIGLSHEPGMFAGTGGLAMIAPAPLTGVPATRVPSLIVQRFSPAEFSSGFEFVPLLRKSK